MEALFGLLAILVVVGIPVSAIVALVRSKDALRKSVELDDKLIDAQGEIARLGRELTQMAGRIQALESQPLEAQAHQRAAAKPPEPESATATSPAAEIAAVVEDVASAAAAPLEQSLWTLAKDAHESIEPPTKAAVHAAEPSVARLEIPKPEEPPVAEPVVARVEERPEPVAPPVPPAWYAAEVREPRVSVFDRLRTNLPLEQLLGMNLFAKIGIVLLVLGFALLGRIALIAMGPAPRVALIYAAAGALLGGGIWLERRERYRLVGRTGIGGGWALLFFTTYAMSHVAPMMVLASNTLDCLLMLIVAVAMVVHTLRYRSQLVTGLAFLLAFSTVALSQDSVYALAAGVILALGIVVIALRMKWFELEVFGILASYANHFYWLYKLYPDGVAGHAFAQFWPSTVILVFYWLTFRVSYVARRIEAAQQEMISTVAALANTMLLGVVMRFQSTHPEWTFYGMLAMGALEFAFGQLPVTRRRKAAFTLLTVLGTLLVFAAVPFKFSGNSIALFWMIAAEALLIAGIAQREQLFRRLGLLAGCVTGLLIVFEARGLVELRMTAETLLMKDGVLLLTASAFFYANALLLRRRWSQHFTRIESAMARAQSYLGCATAFLGVWALCTADATAVGWVALLLSAVVGTRWLDDDDLHVQAWALTAAVVLRAGFFNCHFDSMAPHHNVARLLTLPLLALCLYGVAWILSGLGELQLLLRTVVLWGGSVLLALLIWLEVPQVWVAPAWMAQAAALCLLGRRLRLVSLNWQQHALAVAVALQLFNANLDAPGALQRYLPLIGCAVAFYALSRFSTQADAVYRRSAAWLHTWTATALLAALGWHEAQQSWLAVVWILFAVVLALIDRWRKVEELPGQAHVLAAMAVVRAMSWNYFDDASWHGVHVRLLSVSVLAAGLYVLARWIRMPESLPKPGVRHIYTWVGSGLTAWLLWAELQPIGVALGLGVFALLLYELGAWRAQRQLRLQAYVLLAASFARIFFVNLTAETIAGEWLSPRIYAVAPLVLIYFSIWWRLQADQAENDAGRLPVRSLIAYFGTGAVAAMLYYHVSAEWVIVAWGLLVVVLVSAALWLGKEVFLEQSILLTGGVVARGLVHNLFGASYFADGSWQGRFSVPALTALLLLLTLPMAFRLRRSYAEQAPGSLVSRWLAARHPEQTLFFAPLALIVLTIALKMDQGMITLAWGVVGVAVILLGLLTTERSYRLTGLVLLLVCVGKIVVRDAWHLNERDRYITFIVLGAALTLVSTLYSKYRDQVSRLL